MVKFSHPECYARSLCNCSNELTGEHWVSASVLELLGEEHIISQASWLSPGQFSRPILTGALVSRVLCKHHNEALSVLDACAKTFFSKLLQALSEPSTHTSPRQVSVDSDKLERWVLKVCCGALASGSLTENGRRIVREPPLKWLNILFSGAAWEPGTGLHILKAPLTPHLGYSTGPVKFGKIWGGGGIEFAGVTMFVLMDSNAEKQILEQSTNQVNRLIYRPGVITIDSSLRRTEIELQWRTWVPTKGVSYTSMTSPQ